MEENHCNDCGPMGLQLNPPFTSQLRPGSPALNAALDLSGTMCVFVFVVASCLTQCVCVYLLQLPCSLFCLECVYVHGFKRACGLILLQCVCLRDTSSSVNGDWLRSGLERAQHSTLIQAKQRKSFRNASPFLYVTHIHSALTLYTQLRAVLSRQDRKVKCDALCLRWSLRGRDRCVCSCQGRSEEAALSPVVHL